MMRRAVGAVLLFLTLFLIWPAKGTQSAPPGKPKFTSCRSPDKETFTCWWQPSSDGGLPTTYALYFRKENSDKVYECPDYHTAGGNSCFFNKNETSIWINYNITVVATNALGSTFSDPVDIDVVYIVQPHTPENVTAQMMQDNDGPFLRVSWEPPRNADTRSGWITLLYELRVRLEGEEEWEEHRAGHQKTFNIFSLRSGGLYLVQVRCKPDHGFWSEWSSPIYIKGPDYMPQETSMWILLVVFSAFIVLFLTWILILKSHRVKHCLLPPIPGPKIKGFDKQLLKSAGSEEVFNVLVVPGFPPSSSNREDLLVEYLEVYTCDEQELILDEGKDGRLKPKGSRSDSDSGRGSCDSHTLLLEKGGDVEAMEEEEERLNQQEAGRRGAEEVSRALEATSPDAAAGRGKTCPSVFPPLPQYTSITLDQRGSPCSSPSAPASCPAQLGYSANNDLVVGAGSWESQNVRPQAVQPYWAPHAHSDFSIPSQEHNPPAAGLHGPPCRSMEYVEVQRVNQENMVILQRLSPGHGEIRPHTTPPAGEDYSKVKGMDGSNVLLAWTEDSEGTCPWDTEESGGEAEYCYTISSQAAGKLSFCVPTARPLQEDVVLATNGYVDTAAMLPHY